MAGWGHVWQGACMAGGTCVTEGGMHGREVCMAGVHVWQGHAWQGRGGMCGRGCAWWQACIAGGDHGRAMHGRGMCGRGGVHGRGHVWQGA